VAIVIAIVLVVSVCLVRIELVLVLHRSSKSRVHLIEMLCKLLYDLAALSTCEAKRR
jgi:hypothetical protein